MRALWLLPLLAAVAVSAAPVESVVSRTATITVTQRDDRPPRLDDLPPEEAREATGRSNPAGHLVDRVVDLSDRLPPPRMTGPVTLPPSISYQPGDNCYRLIVPRINLSGGAAPRFLTMELEINVGQDLTLLESLDEREAVLLNELDRIFQPLGFEEIRHLSQKMALRDEMIIRFNQALDTRSVKDVYYRTFLVF